MVHVKREIDTKLMTLSGTGSTAAQTANFDSLDGSGIKANWATIRLYFRAEVNTSAVGPVISILESNDTVVTNFATIVADRTNEDLTAARLVRYEVDMRKRKRYLRVSLTPGTNSTNDLVTYTVLGTLSRVAQEPANETAQAEVVVAV